MKKYSIKYILSNELNNTEVNIFGWVKNKRISNNIAFLIINDGSTIQNLQIVVDFKNISKDNITKINIGSSVDIIGTIVKSSGNEQSIEIQLSEIKLLSDAKDYPIQPKKHTLEFLREKSNLRIRTNIFNAIFRIRSAMSFAIHDFFQERNFIYINTPILTPNDCEGAGDMFTVTSLDLERINKTDNFFKDDFFSKHVKLTVSGQLEAETTIFGLKNVYTFGPTFRAENSNTTRHLAEFWMVEPEMAFFNLKDNIKLAEKFIKTVIKKVIVRCYDELIFLDNRLKKEKNESLIEKIEFVISNKFEIIDYNEAFKILLNCEKNKTGKFKYKINKWGCDLQSEHERFLTEEYFKKPIIVKNYPEKVKAFYMRLNDDNKTVAAMDVLFPEIGEIIGGSQREERLDFLEEAIKRKNIKKENLDWYLDTRRFGSVVHSGFGLGLERLVQFITGMDNIRDVILFPRYPKHCNF
jgi:asparaginyl-tRNA synthetase